MKIVYDYQIFSAQSYGGVSRYFSELAKCLYRRQGGDVKILAPLYKNNYVHALDTNIVTGFHAPEIPKTGKLLNVCNHMISKYWLGKVKPDILHETYYTNKSIAVNGDAKTVITVYDMIHEKFSDYFSSGNTTALVKLQAVKRANHVICVSETTKQDLLNITGIEPNKISVVHLGFDLVKSPEVTKGEVINEPYILYVGMRNGYKNFKNLLKAYSCNQAIHKHCKLVCFGGGKFTAKELEECARLGLSEDRLLWFGGSDQILARLYRYALAFVYPSLYEGFGIPPLEAMSHGCPVVCSAGGSIPEVVGDAGEFFDPYNEEAIGEAIERVIASSERTEILRTLGEKRITQFSWESCANETYKVYESLI